MAALPACVPLLLLLLAASVARRLDTERTAIVTPGTTSAAGITPLTFSILIRRRKGSTPDWNAEASEAPCTGGM